MTNKTMDRKNLALLTFAGLFITITLSSCFGSKPVAYFNGEVDTTKLNNIKMPDPIIQKGDMLSITIYSDNPDATAIFNQAGLLSPPSRSTSDLIPLNFSIESAISATR